MVSLLFVDSSLLWLTFYFLFVFNIFDSRCLVCRWKSAITDLLLPVCPQHIDNRCLVCRWKCAAIDLLLPACSQHNNSWCQGYPWYRCNHKLYNRRVSEYKMSPFFFFFLHLIVFLFRINMSKCLWIFSINVSKCFSA